jgi:hypothetical protein
MARGPLRVEDDERSCRTPSGLAGRAPVPGMGTQAAGLDPAPDRGRAGCHAGRGEPWLRVRARVASTACGAALPLVPSRNWPPSKRAQLPGLLALGAKICGFEDEVWSTRRITVVIEQVFGVRYHPAHLSRYCGRSAGVRRNPSCGRSSAPRRPAPLGMRSTTGTTESASKTPHGCEGDVIIHDAGSSTRGATQMIGSGVLATDQKR